jgi:hypothetical protein
LLHSKALLSMAYYGNNWLWQWVMIMFILLFLLLSTVYSGNVDGHPLHDYLVAHDVSSPRLVALDDIRRSCPGASGTQARQ